MRPKFVRIVNGYLKEYWDSPPPVPVGTDGWKDCIEVFPEITEKWHRYGEPTFDLTKDPVERVFPVIDVPVQERKDQMFAENTEAFKTFAETVSKSPLLYSQEDVIVNKLVCSNNHTAIENAQTHEELDAIVLEKIKYF